jgi:hypothetical protein
MKFLSVFTIAIFLITSSCHNPGIAKGIPKCIYKEIDAGSQNADWMIGSVKEYEFQGKTVYAFEPDNGRIADGATTIKDGACNTLCNVGGFAGPRNNQCMGGNFFTDAVYKRTIWEKK